MKALVVLVHYFAAEADPRHSSVDGLRREMRTGVVQQVIRGYRGAFGPASTIRYPKNAYVIDASWPVDVDIRILTVPDHSLIEKSFRDRFGVSQTSATLSNPRTLGFEAHRIFARFADRYDWFVYSEDDLLVRDPLFFDKLTWFNHTFGDGRILAPNRFEWNDAGETQKTYIDHDLDDDYMNKVIAAKPDQDRLSGQPLAREVGFQRASNPHSGFFAVTKPQLAYWMAKSHWLERDMRFISPLESAATLGLAKTFSVYKAQEPSAGFLEIEHLDSRFSSRKMRVDRTRFDARTVP